MLFPCNHVICDGSLPVLSSTGAISFQFIEIKIQVLGHINHISSAQ